MVYSGLYYFNARWYDPKLGRFTTEDPARDGINWFIYCLNNPLRWIDPTGIIFKAPSVVISQSDQRWKKSFLGGLPNYD